MVSGEVGETVARGEICWRVPGIEEGVDETWKYKYPVLHITLEKKNLTHNIQNLVMSYFINQVLSREPIFFM